MSTAPSSRGPGSAVGQQRPADASPAASGLRECEVLVVGAGPTGLLLACLLALRGVDVQVLEQREQPSEHSRAIGLHPPAVAALEQVGLAEAAVAQGAPIRAGRARSRGRDLGRLHFARAWPERPYVLSLPQSRTVHLLEQRLADLAPGALHRGWELTALGQLPGGIEVTARRPQASPTEGDAATAVPAPSASSGVEGPQRWRARVVVGADGTRSRVRELLGVGTTAVMHPDRFLMGDFRDDSEHHAAGGDATDGRAPSAEREAVIHLEPAGVVESFPLPGGRRRWVAHTGQDASARSPAELARIVASRTGIELDVDSTSMISAFAVRSRLARRMVAGRAVLIGDAAHEISPIGGQGITLGWADALALAPLLAAHVQHGAGDQLGPLRAAPALRRFERDRRRAARLAARMAQLNMALGRPTPVGVVRGRDLLLRLLLGTPLRHLMAWMYSMGWARPSGP